MGKIVSNNETVWFTKGLLQTNFVRLAPEIVDFLN
jgi:hypothetical protein